MSARAVTGDSAVMNQQHEASEGGADGVSGPGELGHIFGGVFIALERAVERVDDDHGGGVRELCADGGAERRGFSGQVDRLVDEVEWRVLRWLEASPPRFDAARESVASL